MRNTNARQPGNKPQDANKPKPPAFPAWSTFVPPAPPGAGLPPNRPLPTPGQAGQQPQQQQPLPPGQPNHQMSMIPGAVPPPPGMDVSAVLGPAVKDRKLIEADETSPHVIVLSLRSIPYCKCTRDDIVTIVIMCTASIRRYIIQDGPGLRCLWPPLCIIQLFIVRSSRP